MVSTCRYERRTFIAVYQLDSFFDGVNVYNGENRAENLGPSKVQNLVSSS